MMSEEQKRQDDIDTIVIWHGKGYTDSQIVKMWNEVEEEYGGNRMLDEVTVRKVLEEERERERAKDHRRKGVPQLQSEDPALGIYGGG